MTFFTSTLIDLAAALGDATRVRLLVLLDSGAMTVGKLSTALGIAQSSTSYHVGRLEDIGLVRVVRRGRTTVVHRNHRRWIRVVEAFTE